MNIDGLELGSNLSEFKSFTAEFPPDMKGLAISNSDIIRDVHNSFARSDPFISDPTMAKEDDDVFHFIAYMPVGGQLYELDGLKQGPVNHGPCGTEGDWIEKVRPIITERMAKYSSNEIRFALMGVVRNRTDELGDQLQSVEKQLKEEMDPTILQELEAEKARIVMDLDSERAKRERWRKENQRRRTNFVGLIYALLKEMAKKDLLQKHLDQKPNNNGEPSATISST
ncbi:hypothetical protein HK102_006636 [Quaeritorhiza haematococci]|nr:hypothetical protein HK102_006636 [Quaeritorhiza haematococci]